MARNELPHNSKQNKSKKEENKAKRGFSMNNSAILSHLSSLNNSNIPKANHGIRKLVEKQALIPGERLHHPPRPVIP